MKYTTDQLELIAIMFKIQFRDKTFKELFPDLEHARYEGKIDELVIDHKDEDANFRSDRTLVAFFDLFSCYFVIFNSDIRKRNFYTKTEDIVNMLNFKDKV